MRPIRHRGASIVLAVLVVSLLALGVAVAAPSSRRALETAPRSPVALPSATTDVRGLEPALAAVAAAAEASGTAGARSLALARGVRVSGDRVTVAVEGDAGDLAAARKAVAAAGGRITAEADGVLRADVPAARLKALAAADGVLRVRKPRKPYQLGVSEGVHMTAADQWQAAGRTGAGVKVGIIDAGFYGYETMSGADFPDASHLTTASFGVAFTGSGDGFHGTAVTEVVHDMAPGADYYLAAVGDEFDARDAENWMASHGVRVVNMSLGWIGSPLDGGRTGDVTVNRAVTKAVTTDGIFWANAAGNFRLNHWRGDFYPAASSGDGRYEQDWGGRAALNLFVASSDPVEGLLWWKDNWSAAVNDYDLLLYHGIWADSNHTRISRFELVRGYEGDARQWGRSGDKPYEEVYYPAAVPGDVYGWVIVNERPWAVGAVSGQHGALPANRTAVDFDFFCPNQDLLTYRPYRSIMTPADNESPGFVAVGAACAQWSIDPDFLRPGFAQQEPYSSEGPNARGVSTLKLAAPDDVTNLVMAKPLPYGFDSATFRGTSASSPHVAGAAALVLETSPALTPAQLEAFLRGAAVDLGKPGVDNQTGSGSLRLPPLAPPALDLNRIAGTDRYRTALGMSAAWPSGSATEGVVLASGANFPDALAGSSLAGALGSPILLTKPDSISGDIIAELHRLTSGVATPTVHVLGGAVSPQIVVKLKGEGFRVTRLAGKDRYETAVKIANAALDRRWRGTCFVVTGKDFADALSVAPYAYSVGIPVIPVGSNISTATQAFLKSGRVHSAIIIGGTAGVTRAEELAIPTYGVAVDVRWYGANRYETMKAVVSGVKNIGWLDYSHMGIASGTNFPDALAGAAYVGRDGGGLLLTKPNILVGPAADIVTANKAELQDVRLLGGKSSVQGAVWLGVRDLTD